MNVRKPGVPHQGSTPLRQQAEQRLRSPQEGPTNDLAARELLHELEVHQVELELQNEELRATRLEVEAGLQRYTELFDFAPIGYVTLTPPDAIDKVNHAAAHLLGRERARLPGSRLGAHVAVGDRPALLAMLDAAQGRDDRQSCEVALVTPGRSELLHVRLTAGRVDWGSERRLLVTMVDVSERKAREAALQRSEQALREADHRKDEFLAALSHELRNPLAPIRNSLAVMARAAPGSEQAQKARAVIDRQVTHLTRLVDDLLDVSRITRGKAQLRRERVELGELVRRTLEDHRASFEAGGIRLEGRFEVGACWVDADPARLVQALSNLLANAEKFTPRRGSVVVRLRRGEGHAELAVKDSGVGIEPHLLPHVFEPFLQGPQTLDRTRGGLGLGLAMVKGLIELHGGTVVAASEGLHRGTEVTLRLPLSAAPAEPARTAPPEPAPARARRVLVIEDNADTADSLRDALELSGHTVAVAGNGHEGIELAHAFRPEVILCDIGLPGMTGYEVARALRADESLRGLYLVALSGYALPEDRERAAAAGFDRHVAKPPSLWTLERLLAEV